MLRMCVKNADANNPFRKCNVQKFMSIRKRREINHPVNKFEYNLWLLHQTLYIPLGCCRTDSLAFHSDLNFDPSKDDASSVQPFPCPFCDRAYTSWGFRRRHIKSMHTASPKLTCKWCPQVLSSHHLWEEHVIAKHGLAAEDARNGLLILEEAHTVLQIPNPTKLESVVDMIKRGEVVTEPVRSQGDKSSGSSSSRFKNY